MRSDFHGILIMSDLDGTFLDSKGRQVERNLRALDRFRAGGGLFSFATGRVHTTIEKFVLPNYQELINCPAIMCNGSCVYDAKKETLLFEEWTEKKTILSIVKKLFTYPFDGSNFYVGDDYTCLNNTSPDEIDENRWNKAIFYGKSDLVMQAYQMVLAEPDRPYTVFRSSPNILEILPKTAGKGPMLDRLKAWYEEQGTEVKTIGVGDYENDLTLITHADVGICPSNALPMLKEKADRIMCSNDEGVIADTIEAIERGELL